MKTILRQIALLTLSATGAFCVPAATNSAEKAVDDQIKADLDSTFLRKNGFAINLGYGYVADLQSYAPDVQVRYNFLQQSHIEDVHLDRRNGGKRRLAEKLKDAGFAGSTFTDFSGWVGYSLEKYPNQARTVGTVPYAAGAEKEAPLLIGLSLGFGNGSDFSSAVSINVGMALFKNRAFKERDAYYGLSVDAVLFKAIVKALASATGK